MRILPSWSTVMNEKVGSGDIGKYKVFLLCRVGAEGCGEAYRFTPELRLRKRFSIHWVTSMSAGPP